MLWMQKSRDFKQWTLDTIENDIISYLSDLDNAGW